MKESRDGVTVTILGKEFIVACPEDERAALVAAAGYLDKKMREIQTSGKVIGTERTAIMAALNIAHELLELRERGGMSLDMSQKIKFLQSKIDAALRWDAQTRQ
ncbi:MAG TPA: cell division protein ZapA [Candidatus Methylomirabilis sp.]|nr:cell division protein ZapA [Candidatus Methylomirabilis sp.]